MNDEALEQGYALAERFVQLLSQQDAAGLQRQFDVSDAVYDELWEALGDYYSALPALSLLPYSDALTHLHDERSRYDFFAFQQPLTWGLDCNLMVDGQLDEPVIHFRVRRIAGEFVLEYLCLDS